MESLASIQVKCLDDPKKNRMLQNQIDQTITSLNDEADNMTKVYNKYVNQFDLYDNDIMDGKVARPLDDFQSFQNELEKTKQYNNEMFLNKEDIKKAKEKDEQLINMMRKTKKVIWMPDKLKMSKRLTTILKMQ